MFKSRVIKFEKIKCCLFSLKKILISNLSRKRKKRSETPSVSELHIVKGWKVHA